MSAQIPPGWTACKQCGAYNHPKEPVCPKCGTSKDHKADVSPERVFDDAAIRFYNDHHHHSARTTAQPESTIKRKGVELANGSPVKETSAERVHLRIVSVRKRLCDPDNLVAKWYIDCLRYCRIIRDDTAQSISLETTQRKAAKGEAEHTILEIIYPE